MNSALLVVQIATGAVCLVTLCALVYSYFVIKDWWRDRNGR